jgi:hypothetical protein
LYWSVNHRAEAALISGISYLPKSGSNYQEPANVIAGTSVKHLPQLAGSRGVRGDRDNAQTFTVSGTEFPTGLDVGGFVMFYEAGSTTSLGTFNVELFSVADPTAATLASSSSVSGSLLVSGTGLNFVVPDASHAQGTAVFGFDSMVHLDPGSYAWRFLVPGAGTTNLFQWAPTSSSNTYSAGRKYEGDADTLAQSTASATGDFTFAFVVPEPMSWTLMCIALVGVGAMGLRNRRRT